MMGAYPYEAVNSLAETNTQRLQGILERPYAIEKLAKLKPEVLADSMERVLFIQSNIQLFERAVKSLNESKPEMAAKLVDALPDGPAKEKLAEKVKR